MSDFVIKKNILLSFDLTLRELKFPYNAWYILVVPFLSDYPTNSYLERLILAL